VVRSVKLPSFAKHILSTLDGEVAGTGGINITDLQRDAELGGISVFSGIARREPSACSSVMVSSSPMNWLTAKKFSYLNKLK